MIIIKRLILFVLAILLILSGCSSKDQEKNEIDANPDTVDSNYENPVLEEEKILIDSQMVEFDPGMVYRYVGDDLIFQPKGWNVALELPETWKNEVAVFCTHPNADTLTISVVPNALIEAYMTALDRPAMNSHYDYAVRLLCLSRNTALENYSETAALIYEDSQFAYYLDTNLSRSPDSQESLIQQLLIDKIGQEQYDSITSGFQLTLDDAKKLFLFTERQFSTITFEKEKAGAVAKKFSAYIEQAGFDVPLPVGESMAYVDEMGRFILPLQTENGGIPATVTAALAYDPNSGTVTSIDYLWRLSRKTGSDNETFISRSGLRLCIPAGYRIEANTNILHFDSQFLGKMYTDGGYYFEIHAEDLTDPNQPWQQEVVGADGFEIARDETYSYMLWRATDVQYDPSNEAAKEQFEKLESVSEQWAEAFVFDNNLIKNPYWSMDSNGYADNKSALRMVATNTVIEDGFLYVTVPVPFDYSTPEEDYGAWTLDVDSFDGEVHTYTFLEGKHCIAGMVYQCPIGNWEQVQITVACENEPSWTYSITR